MTGGLKKFVHQLLAERFDDGSKIQPSGRDDYIYWAADGRSVKMYIFVTGPQSPFDRVVALSSLQKWHDGSLISDTERSSILMNVSRYRYFRRQRIGVNASSEEEQVRSIQELLGKI